MISIAMIPIRVNQISVGRSVVFRTRTDGRSDLGWCLVGRGHGHGKRSYHDNDLFENEMAECFETLKQLDMKSQAPTSIIPRTPSLLYRSCIRGVPIQCPVSTYICYKVFFLFFLRAVGKMLQ